MNENIPKPLLTFRPGYFPRVLCFLLFYSWKQINVSVNLAHCLTRLAAEHPGQRRQYADQPIYFPHTEVPSSRTIFYSPSILYFFNFIEFGSLQCITLHCISMHCLTWFLNIWSMLINQFITHTSRVSPTLGLYPEQELPFVSSVPQISKCWTLREG